MADTIKFPNDGYEVTVCKKSDILECIDKNIVDKDVALAIVEHCEFHAANFIRQGRWAGIPFIGNIRVPKTTSILQTTEQQALIAEAKEQLTKEQYIMFRTRLNKENAKHIKQNRYFNYITSIVANNNKKLYKRLCERKGEAYAKCFLYFAYNATIPGETYTYVEDDEQ